MGVLFVFIGIFIITEILYRKGISAEITRKIAHVFSALVIIFLPLLLTLNEAIWMGLGYFLFFFLAEKRRWLPSITCVQRKTNGSFFYPLGVTIAAVVGWDKSVVFQFAVLVLGIADTAAWLVGSLAKSGQSKTLKGSAAFFIVTFVLSVFFGLLLSKVDILFLSKSLTLSALLTIIEALARGGSDNLFLPAFAAIFGLVIF
ncbi:MAG: hypothetical protein UW69_C0006G0016 [Microgenomates group bacterium GW2011_GWA2_44_7]|nr:MAG: hypothetical protein UW69_C0006G0016 [Microgenomates group bacterium GW2011_GWA2_44_7]KKT78233.1 MAG: hypothetical protein UW73_C0005G0058 [Microgenomates group bacterium GW2011_GWB1_44_8]